MGRVWVGSALIHLHVFQSIYMNENGMDGVSYLYSYRPNLVCVIYYHQTIITIYTGKDACVLPLVLALPSCR
jgi:hypothetical protein